MNPLAMTLKHLLAAGVTGDALVTAINEIEGTLKPTKSSGAERTAKWREKKNVTERHRDTESATSVAQQGELNAHKSTLSADKGASEVGGFDVSQDVTSYNILSLSKGIEKEESKPVVIARGRKKYPEQFEKFWSAFPTDGGMSKSEAEKVYAKLSEEDQQAAIDGIPGLRKWASGQGTTYRMIHAVNYLKQRRFEGLTGFSVQTSEFSAARELARRIGRA